MKRNLISAAIAATLFAAPALGQQGMGSGTMGPGMMGPGMMGPGTMGPGTMGPGMMGPGMMGPGMMGPGMMGPGMMGPGMMGPGMMGGIDLTDEQRGKISEIRQDLMRKHWDLMGKMHEQHYRMQELYGSGKTDESAERTAYEAMSAAHKQMFDSMLEARKRMDAVLTPEQRQQLRRSGRGSG